MSAAADWYPDPAQSGRLRYWDGTAWTSWVSTHGDTSVDPAPPPAGPPPGIAPPPAAAPAPAPEPVPAAQATPPAGDQTAYLGQDPGAAMPSAGGPGAFAPPPSATPSAGFTPGGVLTRGGLAVAAVGSILIAASAGQTATSQGPFFEVRIEQGFWSVLIVTALLAAAAVLPFLWARLAGLALAGVTALSGAVLVIAARTTDDFVSGIDVTVETGGWLLTAGTLLIFLGIALTLVGFGTAPPPRGDGAGLSTTALILGIASIFFPLVSTLGAAFGLLGMRTSRQATGRTRGTAIAGFVIATVILVAGSLSLIVAMLVAAP